MGFSIETTLENYEYRTTLTGEVEGNKWMQLVIEHPETCEQSKVSVPADMRGIVDVMPLSKGDHINLRVKATAGANYSRMQLIKIVSVVDSDGEVTQGF